MHRIKSGKIPARTGKSNLNKTIERFVEKDNAFSFMNSLKGTSAYWKQFLYDAPAKVKQLGIHTYPCIL